MMALEICEPRWTKPVLVLAGEQFQVTTFCRPEHHLNAALRRGDENLPLDVLASRPCGDGRHLTLTCRAAPGTPAGLYELTATADGDSAASPNSLRVAEGFTDPFVFLHTSDLHLPSMSIDGVLQERLPVAERLVRMINEIGPAFVINTGDVLNRYGRDTGAMLPPEVVQEQARLARGTFLDLEVPMFLTPGNHDVAFPWSRAAWAEHMGAPWHGGTEDYSFDYGEYHFTCLDASVEYDETTREARRSGFTSEQLSWLADDMQSASSKRLRFVFCHFDYQRQLTPLLAELRVSMVLYGHTKPSLYEDVPLDEFRDGHLPYDRAYQLVHVADGKVSVELGARYLDL